MQRRFKWLDQDGLCGGPNPAGADLRSLMRLIRNIIDSKPEQAQFTRPRAIYID
jgi:hypothetical protein